MADLATEILIGFAINANPAKWRVVAVTKPGEPMPFFEKPTIATQPSVTVVRVGFDAPLVVYRSDALHAVERRKARLARAHYAEHGRLSEAHLLVLMQLAMDHRKTRRTNHVHKTRLAARSAAM